MKTLNSVITATLEKLYNSEYTPEISVAPKPELGEYCINIFPLAKTAGKAPNLISEEVATELAKHTDIFVSTSATGGYVNFFLTESVWMEVFQSLNQSNNQPIQQSTIVVDYIGANAGKPLHIGHICTPSIGQVICNTYRHLGYRVIGDSHFGDWGGIFGKLIYAWNDLFVLLPNEYDKELSVEMHKRNIHFKQWSKEEQTSWKEQKLNNN
ncbi:MAG: arginine--tRNA ligase [Patescibacteria group bacterium]